MKARTLTNVHHLVGEADVCDVCVILCVSVSTCVATASMWKLADHVSYQSLSSTLVEAGSDFCCCHYFVFVCLFATAYSRLNHDPPVFTLSLSVGALGLWLCATFGAGTANLGPQTCPTSIFFFTKPSSQPFSEVLKC